MVPITELWLPIVLSAVIVFVASSIIHMLLTYHRSDYRQLPDEDKALAALRGFNLKPGLYIFPFCTHKDMKSPAAMERYKQGPVGHMTIIPSGPPNMPKYLVQWFVYCLIIGFFVAYLTGRTLPPGTHYLTVFRVAGTAAFMAYGLGQLSNGIWKGQPWSATIKEVIDGLVYGLLTAGTFGWLWPH
jgi:DNA topoisomerase IA